MLFKWNKIKTCPQPHLTEWLYTKLIMIYAYSAICAVEKYEKQINNNSSSIIIIIIDGGGGWWCKSTQMISGASTHMFVCLFIIFCSFAITLSCQECKLRAKPIGRPFSVYTASKFLASRICSQHFSIYLCYSFFCHHAFARSFSFSISSFHPLIHWSIVVTTS